MKTEYENTMKKSYKGHIKVCKTLRPSNDMWYYFELLCNDIHKLVMLV